MITRGIKHLSDQFIVELQGKYLPMKYPINKKLETHMIQVAVRPIQLYEVVFPEEHLDLMLTTLAGKSAGKTNHKEHKKYLWAFRKALKLKPVPEYNSDNSIPIYKPSVDVNILGIKTDYFEDITTGEHIKNPTAEQKKNCFEGL